MAYTRVRNFEGVTIPSATSMRPVLCGSRMCNSVHLIGFDEEGEPIFEIVVSKSVHDKMSRMFEEIAGR